MLRKSRCLRKASISVRNTITPRGQQEVTDLLLVHYNRALVIQIKCQQDPERRQDDKLLRWVGTNAREAANQLSGTIRSLRERNYWCGHPTLGRVEFAKDELIPSHGIVLVEHRSPELHLPPDLPLKIRDVPVSYFTLSDFLKIVGALKTFRDIADYLQARHSLGGFDLRSTGNDEAILGHYMFHNGVFPELMNSAQRVNEIFEKWSDFERFYLQKQLGDHECEEVEAAARALRKRAAGYPQRTKDDTNYRLMQLALMDLTYAERRLVGRKMRQAYDEVSNGELSGGRMCCRAILPVSNPGFGIVVAATREVGPRSAIKGMPDFVQVVRRAVPIQKLLWINIRENSPRYQFLYCSLPEEHNAAEVRLLDTAPEDPRTIAAWIARTPEARF
jgi:hypothetical protein